MQWASSISVSSNPDDNIRHCVDEIRDQLKNPPDIALLFATSHFSKDYERIQSAFYDQLSCKTLIGCSAGGIIGEGKEAEGMPGISLMAGILPGVDIHPFHLEQSALPSLDGSPRQWEDLFGVTPKESPVFLLLCDPFSFSAEEWLDGLDFAFPRTVKVGGFASAAAKPGENALFMNREIFHSGLVGVSMTGDVVLDTVVAQGCYPIGPALRITDCEENLLKELDGRPALEVLAEILSEIDPREQEKVAHSLFLGIVMDTMKETYAPGDFLIRNLMGSDPEEGHILVASRLYQGRTVQFHLRDAKASASDLDAVLSSFIERHQGSGYTGALLFSCLGRGQDLYGHPNHDAEQFQHYLGKIPLAGFFCNGEIGPVGGMTYLHGYTSCFGIFRAKE